MRRIQKVSLQAKLNLVHDLIYIVLVLHNQTEVLDLQGMLCIRV